jgi:hypothetical protein
MLRNVLLGIGVASLACGAAVFALYGFGPAFPVLIWAALLTAGIVFERFRYKALDAPRPGAGWEKTSERFIDDETGKPVTVYIRPETGERRYVEE